MSTASRLAARLFFLVLLMTVSHTSLRAQERAPENRPAPIVTATISAERVRFIAPSDTTAVRLEVYTVDGQRLFDSGFKPGTLLDWTMLDEQGQRHPAGTYLCVVAVKSLSGRVSHKLGTLNISAEGTASLEPAKATGLSAAQLQALGVGENSSALTVLREREAVATTSIANTGTDGAITRGQGALSFRVGDFYGGKDKEQMRLTEEGHLGIGTDSPQAKLDVNGVIRAREGIEFNDGSLLNVSPKGKLSLTLPGGKTEAVNGTGGDAATATGGTGTTNQVAKWTDSAGNLGDSLIFDNGLGVGVGTTDLSDVLVAGNDKFKVVDGPMTFSFRDFATGQGYFAVGSSANGIKGFIGHTNTADGFTLGTFSTHKLTIRTDSVNRLTIDTAGNVGIGTSVPTHKLDVAGNVRVSGDGNGIIFPDGSRMTTATSGGGTPSGTSIVSAINDPTTTGTINDNRLSANLARLNSANTFTGNQTVNGSVGIGTASPQFKLHVVGQDIRLEGDTINTFPRFSWNFTGGALNEKKWQAYATTRALSFSALNDAENGETIWLRVIRGGADISSVEFPRGKVFMPNLNSRLGIGTDNPQFALHIVGLNGAFGGNRPIIRVESANLGPAPEYPGFSLNFARAGADEKKWQHYATHNSLNFSALNDAENAESIWLSVNRAGTAINSVVFPTGDIGVGTTATPQAKLHIVDSAVSRPALRVQNTSSGSTVASFGDKGEFQIDSPGVAGGRLNIKENGTVILGDCPGCYTGVTDRLVVGGTVRITGYTSGGSISVCRNASGQIAACSSSIRYKTNIANFSSGLNLINRLRPVTFDWKENKAHDLGLVAEEVAEVEPPLVIHNSKGEVEGVKYDRLNVVLVNAIKEQQAQIKSQADAFAALQKENLEMKRRLAALEQSLRQQR